MMQLSAQPRRNGFLGDLVRQMLLFLLGWCSLFFAFLHVPSLLPASVFSALVR